MSTMYLRGPGILAAGVLLLAAGPPVRGATPHVSIAHADEPSECFDEKTYLERYPDVIRAVETGMVVSAKKHFETVGRREGRIACSADELARTRKSDAETCFDEKGYLRRYPDVAAAVGAGSFASGKDHFEKHGRSEGRIACSADGIARTRPDEVETCFNEKGYLRRYPDVAAAVAAGEFASGREHFEKYGRHESRTPCGAADFIPEIPRWLRVVLLVLAVGGVGYASLRRRWQPPTTAIGLALAMSLFAYLDYVLPLKAFIFRDIGSDTINQFWPMMNHLAERLRAGELPMWSFAVGLGQNVYPSWLSDPFALVAMLFGKKSLPNLLGIMHVAKIVVAVGFVARYLQLRGHPPTAVIVGALSFGFCGHMVGRGTWYEYGTEVPIAAFYLFALERFTQSGKFVLLAIATALLGVPQAYYGYLYGLVFTVFALVRILYLRDGMFSTPRAVLVGFLATSLAGVGLSAVSLLPEALTALNSTRVSGNGTGPGAAHVISSNIREPLLWTQHPRVLVTAVGRALSPDFFGDAPRYGGAQNYLEAPLPYAGLLALLLAIPALWLASRRVRLLIGGFLVAAFAYHYFIYFQLILNFFSGANYFKISGFWIQIGLVLCLAGALGAMERRHTLPKGAIAISAAIVVAAVGALCAVARRFDVTVSRPIAWACVALTLTYAAALLVNRAGWRERALDLFLVGLVVAELAGTAAHAIDGRLAIDGMRPFKDAGYADQASEVIARIRKEDPTFFRIERDRHSVFMMDQMMQGYFGTSAYLSFPSPTYVRLLVSMDMVAGHFAAESYIEGLAARPLLLPLLGVKYFVARESPAPLGYALKFKDHGFNVFESRTATSIGYLFPFAVSEAEIGGLATPVERQVAMLHAAVLPDAPRMARPMPQQQLRQAITAVLPTCKDSSSCLRETALADMVSALAGRAVKITSFAHNRVRTSVSSREPGVLVFSIPFDQGWRMFVNGRPVQTRIVDYGLLGVELPAGDHVVELRYWTPGLRPGAALTALSAGALVVAALVARRRRRA